MLEIANILVQDIYLPERMEWEEACKYCKELDLRLPTRNELIKIQNNSDKFKFINDAWFWSSEEFDRKNAWFMSFATGKIYSRLKDRKYYIKCVK